MQNTPLSQVFYPLKFICGLCEKEREEDLTIEERERKK
jgi:hypothetical protein